MMRWGSRCGMHPPLIRQRVSLAGGKQPTGFSDLFSQGLQNRCRSPALTCQDKPEVARGDIGFSRQRLDAQISKIESSAEATINERNLFVLGSV